MAFLNLPIINPDIFYSLSQRKDKTSEEVVTDLKHLYDTNKHLFTFMDMIAEKAYEIIFNEKPEDMSIEKAAIFQAQLMLLTAIDSQIGADKLKELFT